MTCGNILKVTYISFKANIDLLVRSRKSTCQVEVEPGGNLLPAHSHTPANDKPAKRFSRRIHKSIKVRNTKSSNSSIVLVDYLEAFNDIMDITEDIIDNFDPKEK